MLQDWEEAFPQRLAFGLAFFSAFALWEAWHHGRASARLREYAFLLAAVASAASYAVVHDQLTATLSPEYFLAVKGLAGDPRPFRIAVAILAVRGSYWVGLVIGTAMLVANNPSPRRPQLDYPALGRLALLPLAAALAGAALGGVACPPLGFGLRPIAEAAAGPDGAGRLLGAWGIHAGSYLGGFAGGAAAVILVVVRRRAAGR